MKIIGIYKITSPSGKVYVGQSIDIEKRFREYRSLRNCKHQPRIYRSLLKYGSSAHVFKILEECAYEDLNNRERYWQDQFDVVGISGLNCRLTETTEKPRVVSEKTKKKMSRIMKQRIEEGWSPPKRCGKDHHYFGKKIPIESVEKMKATKKANYKKENHPFYKKPMHPNVVAALIAKAKENRGEKHHSALLLLDTATGIYYHGCNEAAEVFPHSAEAIRRYVRGQLKNKTSLILV